MLTKVVYSFSYGVLLILSLSLQAKTLTSFDAVGAINNDHSVVPFSVNIPNPYVPGDASQPFGGVGTRFHASAKLYPGGTFATTGPFVGINQTSQRYLLNPERILGDWFCNGLITNNVPQMAPGADRTPIGNSKIDFQFIAEDGTDLSVFIQDTLKGFDVTKIDSGQPVRTQEGFVLGGMNANKSVMGQVKIETYVISDSVGLQFMNRYYFQHPVKVNNKI